jgi:hypothetical protein
VERVHRITMRQLGQVGGSNSSNDCFSLSTTIVAVPCTFCH